MKLVIATCLTLLSLAGAPGARADALHTAAGVVEGKAALTADGFRVGEQTVAWADVVYASFDRPTASGGPQAVRLGSGEIWRCELVALAGGKLQVRSAVLGERQVPLAQVNAIEFAPEQVRPEGIKTNQLYRTKGEALPGAILWIDAAQVAVDSPLGVIKLPRTDLLTYIFSDTITPALAGEDEVSLTDGTVLRGKFKISKDTLDVDHALLGKQSLPLATVRSILRRPAGTNYLVELPIKNVDARPLINLPAKPQVVAHATGAYLNEVRIPAPCALTYALPKGLDRPRLQAMLTCPDNTRGAVTVRIKSGSAVLVEKSVAGGGKPETLDVMVDGNELTIDVDFAAGVTLPAGVILGDAVLMQK